MVSFDLDALASPPMLGAALVLIALNVGLALWVGLDARKRGGDGPVWAVGALVGGLAGVALYLLWRFFTRAPAEILANPALRAAAERVARSRRS